MVTWKDWWASRTIRFNVYMAAFNTTVLPLILLLDASTLAALGLSERAVIIVTLVINALAALENKRLRANTVVPLAGRSSTGNGYDDGNGAV